MKNVEKSRICMVKNFNRKIQSDLKPIISPTSSIAVWSSILFSWTKWSKRSIKIWDFPYISLESLFSIDPHLFWLVNSSFFTRYIYQSARKKETQSIWISNDSHKKNDSRVLLNYVNYLNAFVALCTSSSIDRCNRNVSKIWWIADLRFRKI